MNITFVTGNPNKAEECSAILGIELVVEALEINEIQSLSLEKVVEAKAWEAYKQLQKPVMVEDTALTLLALNELPGPFIRWFEESIGLEGLCVIATEHNEHRAVATTCVAYCDGEKVELFTGEVLGHITQIPRGENGFGWDKIFQPENEHRTWAEMSREEKSGQSMRKIALEKFKTFLAIALPGVAQDLQADHAQSDDSRSKDDAKDTKSSHPTQDTKKDEKGV